MENFSFFFEEKTHHANSIYEIQVNEETLTYLREIPQSHGDPKGVILVPSLVIYLLHKTVYFFFFHLNLVSH